MITHEGSVSAPPTQRQLTDKTLMQDRKSTLMAEAHGWTNIIRRGHFLLGTSPQTGRECYLPNYFGSLDACHKFEKTLTDQQYREYCDLLDKSGADERGPDYPNRSRSATIDQRIEAFGQTLKLW